MDFKSPIQKDRQKARESALPLSTVPWVVVPPPVKSQMRLTVCGICMLGTADMYYERVCSFIQVKSILLVNVGF